MEKKRKLTPEELSRLRADNARRGAETRRRNGTCRGGRPRGIKGDTDPVRSLSIRQSDYQDVSKMASGDNVTLVMMIHKIVEYYKREVWMSPEERDREDHEVNSQPAVPKEIQDLRMRMLKKMISLEEYDRLRDAYNAKHGTKF